MLPPSWILKKRKTEESEAKSDDGPGGFGLYLTSVITASHNNCFYSHYQQDTIKDKLHSQL